jgi:hypothetical protein
MPRECPGNRQIKRCADFPHVRRRETYGDTRGRQGESGVSNGGPDTIAAFANRGIWQSHNCETGQTTVADVHFDADRNCIDTDNGRRRQSREHNGRLSKPRTTRIAHKIARIE